MLLNKKVTANSFWFASSSRGIKHLRIIAIRTEITKLRNPFLRRNFIENDAEYRRSKSRKLYSLLQFQDSFQKIL